MNRTHDDDLVHKREEHLRLVLHAGRMGTWDWNLATNAVKWSTSLEAIHGLEPGTFPGTFEAYQSDMHPDDRQRVIGKILETVERRCDYHQEYRLVWPDGSIHWIEARGKLLCDEAGKPLHLMGVCIDIDERKQTETNFRFLAQVGAQLSQLLDQDVALGSIAKLAVPVFADWCAVDMVEPDGTLRRLAVAHTDPDRLALAEQLYAQYPPDPAAPGGPYQVLRTGQAEMVSEITDEVLSRYCRDAEHLRLLRQFNLKSYIRVPLVERGRAIGVITFGTAESMRRYKSGDLALAEELASRAAIAIENARLYSEVKAADRRKEEFLAMLAHELRNPLAPLTSALDLLKMGADAETTEWAHGVMERQVQHMVRLVDDLLDVSRITRGKIELRKEPVQLAAVVGRAVEAARPGMDDLGHELTISLPSEPLWLEADATRLTQVVGNLLNNAAKYSDGPGKIWISAERQGGEVVLRVRDTGLGIAPEVLPRIFDLFSQGNVALDRSHGGLGIGLSLVRRLVEMHGGSAHAQSDGLGKGSTFVVRLPLLAVAPQPRAKPALPTATKCCRVLVVDDNVGAATLVARLILKCGNHQVEMAHDGLEALEVARRQAPQLVLLDIGLPKMDGYDVARRLRADRAFDNTVLVALTGYGQQEDRDRSREAGFDEHLVKPASLAALQKLFSHSKLK